MIDEGLARRAQDAGGRGVVAHRETRSAPSSTSRRKGRATSRVRDLRRRLPRLAEGTGALAGGLSAARTGRRSGPRSSRRRASVRRRRLDATTRRRCSRTTRRRSCSRRCATRWRRRTRRSGRIRRSSSPSSIRSRCAGNTFLMGGHSLDFFDFYRHADNAMVYETSNRDARVWSWDSYLCDVGRILTAKLQDRVRRLREAPSRGADPARARRGEPRRQDDLLVHLRARLREGRQLRRERRRRSRRRRGRPRSSAGARTCSTSPRGRSLPKWRSSIQRWPSLPGLPGFIGVAEDPRAGAAHIHARRGVGVPAAGVERSRAAAAIVLALAAAGARDARRPVDTAEKQRGVSWVGGRREVTAQDFDRLVGRDRWGCRPVRLAARPEHARGDARDEPRPVGESKGSASRRVSLVRAASARCCARISGSATHRTACGWPTCG